MSASPEAATLLAHRVAGQGPPLLLLNGGLMSVASWGPVAAPLERRFRVVRCDLRGQLLSPGAPHAELSGHVEDVIALLDALRLDAVHLVGTSFGASVGMLLAARHPERASALVVIAATDRITDDEWRASQPLVDAARDAATGGDGGRVLDLLLPGTYSRAYLKTNARLLAERRAQLAALPPAWFEQLAGLLASLRGLDLRPELGSIRCPTLVVAAGQDTTFPVERSEALAAAIPGAALAVVPDSGHALVVEAPEPLAGILVEFLARLGQRGASS